MARRKKPKITLVIEVDHSKIRKPISPPTQTHNDKKSYNRKMKHKKRFPEGGPLFVFHLPALQKPVHHVRSGASGSA
ncbi:hypothetical protein LZ24_00430 [Desulfobotulus alkaliphilus]|uniref:Uncharacterized protein n=1 Tax=Desulfobotulus alkaliphilus TaxID=622671 RepID=A0A562S6I9_9BACT|nr:hypothetical protein LZ24_00430 [Desulfobotulus alkaliphilus]